MLLVMRNLPSDITYSEIKALIESKCFVDEVILDKLFKDSPTTKKVTVGVAKEDDATKIVHSINGTHIRGLQIVVEDIKGVKAGNNSNKPSGSGYQGQYNQQQMANYQQPAQNPWTAQQMGVYQYGYGYGMPTNQVGYQTQQGMTNQQTNGYQAWMTPNNPGVPPQTQNNFMGYGNPQGQQGQQTNTPYGQYGGSGQGYNQTAGPQKELGFGHPTGNSHNDKEKGANNQRGYVSEASYSGNQRDREPQESWRDSQQGRGRSSQEPWRGSEDRGRGSQHPPNQNDSRSYSSGNIDRDPKYRSGNGQHDSREYGSRHSTNQRERGFGAKYSWENSNTGGSGFDRSVEGNDVHNNRKRRHSPVRSDAYQESTGDRFQRGRPKLEGNTGRGVEGSRESYNRVGPSSRELEKPNNPYTWTKKPENSGGDQARSVSGNTRSFGGETSRSFEDNPRPFGGPDSNKERSNDSKPKIVWNTKYHLRPQISPVTAAPANQPKLENKTVWRAKIDQKTANRSISWRGEGVSSIAKEIFQRQGADSPIKKRGQSVLKLLKQALNTRVEGLIKQKFPDNPYPLLQGPDIVKLYRSAYPAQTDDTLCMSCVEGAPVTATAVPKAQPKPASGPSGTAVKSMGPPSAPTPILREVKPFLPKSSQKPKLSDLLPPQMMQQQAWKPKLMLGPNALKKKPKPYNVEKRARTEQKNQAKREFLDEKLYQCPTPEMDVALDAVLDEITDVFTRAVDEQRTKNKEDKLIGETIKLKVAPEFRAMIRLHTIKRILNITKTLMLRIFVSPGKAPKENIEQALKPYGVLNLRSSGQSKTPMYTAGVKTYHNYDRLATSPGIPVVGRDGPCMITAKPLHLTMPFKFRRLMRQKQYAELTGDYEEKDDFSKTMQQLKDEFDDDDDDYDDDDDVVEVTKECDVIELTEDEATLKVTDDTTEVKNEVATDVNEKAEDVESKDGMVDLTMDEENVNLTAGETVAGEDTEEMGDSVVEIDEDEVAEDDLEDY